MEGVSGDDLKMEGVSGNVPQDNFESDYSSYIDRENILNEWVLTSTPIPVVSVLALYLLFVVVGPRFMKNREPYEMVKIMRVYNAVQVILCLALPLYNAVYYWGFASYALEISCRLPRDSDRNVASLKQVYLFNFWCFVMLKIVDLLDTVFMILRKKNSHITFLHVYHHTAMVFFTWLTMKYMKAHQAVLPGMLNMFVHAIMYSYYFLATFGPGIAKYLWWKKHLTKIQLLQFLVILIYLSILYIYDCPLSKEFMYVWLFNVFVILCLFLDFYIKAYIVSRRQNVKKDL